MIYTLMFGGDARGWTYLAFERLEKVPFKGAADQFEKDVSGVADAMRQRYGEEALLKKESLEEFVSILETDGYRPVQSVSLMASKPGQILRLSCDLLQDDAHQRNQ